MSDRINVIEAAHYGETVDKLRHDPIIEALANDIIGALDRGEKVDVYSYEFMTAALDEYNRRGGTISTHIGGPAKAIQWHVEEHGNSAAELAAGTQ